MGSLPSPPPSLAPPESPENSISRYRVYASFCFREPAPNINVSNWIECYNPCDNTWSRVSSVPQLSENHVLKDFAMTSIANSIYVIGGRLCRKEMPQFPGESDNVLEAERKVLSSVWRYNVNSDHWSRCASLNVPRYNFACDVCDGKIFVVGGQSKLASARGISSAEVYDPAQDVWTPLPNMSTLRYKCVGVTWQGKIHVIGGFAERGILDRIIVPYVDRSSAEVYNTESEKWDLMAGMWQLDVPPHQIVSLDGKLFSSGDCLNAWKGQIEAYDGKLNIWNVVEGSQQNFLSLASYANEENRSQIQRVYYLTMAPIGSHLYFLAIYRMVGESSRTISMVRSFDTSMTGDGWRSFEPQEEEGEKELCSHCCVVQLS
ncbi:hypothetical protein RJ640_030162 [Escallonia rubra]|uniref:Uncharacterized protein n=1 Tax=Escallonia rubra TaxID=112253 RepID=A0AA88U2R1_9ASTE|nr:hypothetical protein RJ640_030162 [Escallonia rubra]